MEVTEVFCWDQKVFSWEAAADSVRETQSRSGMALLDVACEGENETFAKETRETTSEHLELPG